MMLGMLHRLLPGRFDAQRNWRARFAARPDGWAAVSDRSLTDAQYLQAAECKFGQLHGVLMRLGPSSNGRTLLDAGCGYGNFTDAFERAGYDALGVDYIESAVQRARERFPSCRFEVADLSRMSLGRAFDVIVTIDTLINVVEVREWRRILEGFARHLVPGGVVAILERLREPGEDLVTARHVTFRTAEQYAGALHDCGLAIVEQHGFEVAVQGIREHILVARAAG